MVDVTTHQLPWHSTGHHNRQRVFTQSTKLQDVLYEIRGPVHAHAARLEAEGHRILKLNIGNPAPFGFEAPDVIMRDMIQALPYAQGYSDSQGIVTARRAVFTRYELVDGFPRFDIDDVYLGNGVSELITMTLQALLDNGDQVLIPAPDYPLWTASTSLAGGTPVHYLCDETQGWQPDIADMESKITDRTKALVVINPNNPTGAVYSREVLEQIADLARKHQLLLLADEIYDKILYDDAQHISMASVAPDVLTLTFNGLSKAYRVAGLPVGLAGHHRPQGTREQLHRGHQPAGQHAAVPECACAARHSGRARRAPEHRRSGAARRPAARAARRRVDRSSTRSPACRASSRRARCTRSRGWTPRCTTSSDDEQLVLDLLLQEKILVVQGTGFNWPTPGSPAHRDAAVGARPGQCHRAARQLPGGLPPVGPAQGCALPSSEWHIRIHIRIAARSAPLGPLAAKIVVGLLVAIGVAVIAGRPCCGPVSRRSTSRCPSRTRPAARSPPKPATWCPAASATAAAPRRARC